LAQLWPALWQHRRATGVGRQPKSPQQSVATRHSLPEAVQRAQVPLEQLRSPSHEPPVQHARPRPPQVLVTATQRPLWHTLPALHELPGQQG
jgi:hypothetical protein